MALPQQGTETGFDIDLKHTILVLMALPQQGTETPSDRNLLLAKKLLVVLMALPQQGTETLHAQQGMSQ